MRKISERFIALTCPQCLRQRMAGGFKLIKTMISLIVRYGSILTEKNHLVNQKWEGRPLMRPAQPPLASSELLQILYVAPVKDGCRAVSRTFPRVCAFSTLLGPSVTPNLIWSVIPWKRLTPFLFARLWRLFCLTIHFYLLLSGLPLP